MELLRDRSAEFEQAGVQKFGVSRDSPWTHIAWTQALDLNFPLLSDWNGEAVHGFEITREFRGFRGVACDADPEVVVALPLRPSKPGSRNCRDRELHPHSVVPRVDVERRPGHVASVV